MGQGLHLVDGLELRALRGDRHHPVDRGLLLSAPSDAELEGSRVLDDERQCLVDPGGARVDRPLRQDPLSPVGRDVEAEPVAAHPESRDVRAGRKRAIGAEREEARRHAGPSHDDNVAGRGQRLAQTTALGSKVVSGLLRGGRGCR